MISTKYITVEHIPSSWIFEYYCKLNQKLTGQELKIKSLFNPHERTASFWIYPKNGRYRYWDFSSGMKGTGVDLVMALFNIEETEAIKKITLDYEKSGNKQVSTENFVEQPKYKVESYTLRKWNKDDAKFWTSFNINSKTLEHYNVRPLESFSLVKGSLGFTLNKKCTYGFFKADGTLYKVYEPKALNKDFKFLSFAPYTQGSEQLTYTKNTLVICSSLKDIMSLMSLGFDVEAVAPSSENTMISRAKIISYLVKYDRVLTLFDNDQAGHKAMQKYKDMYGIEGIYLNLSKDLSDSIRDFSPQMVRNLLKISL